MVAIQKEVNPHFDNFLFDWEQKFQFLVGGYGSSKSYHAALKIILKLIVEKRTALVIREVYDTHRDSTFSLLSEIVEELGLSDRIRCVTSPMQIRFPNGSKIIFKGMDRPEKLKSINNVSLIWLEECSEVKYAGFKELLGRLRHPSLKLHMILSTNPVGEDNWTYLHFFIDKINKRYVLDDKSLYKQRTMVVGDTYYHHSTADDNLFLPDSYIEQLEEMKEYDPDLHRIARKGRFGVNGKRVLPQFQIMQHEQVMQAIQTVNKPLHRVGMDFGFVTSFNAVLRMVVDLEKHYLYIYWEYYKRGIDDVQLFDDLKEFEVSGERIVADSAEPKTIYYLKKQGLNIKGAHKFPGSRLANTKKMKRFKKIICSDRCENAIHEMENLVYATDKLGNIIPDEFGIDPHTFEAIWYGLDGYEVTDIKGEAQGRPSSTRPQGRRR
ncbi:PBSX family phage terminase large subunit [Sporosarcina sp. P17b]|nr:PBSX family phage terminase large subunit [Sporosarcina sp. P17b]